MKGKEKLIEFCKKFTIDEKEQYNVCIEITIDSKDILSEKIPQLFKMTSCFNFLYNTNQFFNSIEDNSLINDSYSYFKDKTKFINYDKQLILLTISNGNIVANTLDGQTFTFKISGNCKKISHNGITLKYTE